MRHALLMVCALGLLMVQTNTVRAQEVAPQEVVVMASPAATAMTYGQACCALEGLCPGQHTFCIIHPYTCCPVEVCVCLPCGCYDVCCTSGWCAKKLVFDFKGHKNDVVVKFKKNGSVSVH